MEEDKGYPDKLCPNKKPCPKVSEFEAKLIERYQSIIEDISLRSSTRS